MNQFQTKLFNDLMTLTVENDDFSFRDFNLDEKHIARIFNYRLGSYSAFCKDNAMNCRGTMFLLKNNEPKELLSLPMEKFFNNEENPKTQKLDFSIENIKYISNKLDGSLISTWSYNNELKLKSKGSIVSKEVAAATKILDNSQYAELKEGIKKLEELGFTIDLEYTSPNNRIVIEYNEEKLSIVNIRNKENGESFLVDDLPAEFNFLKKFEVETFKPNNFNDFLKEIESLKNFEGLVVCLKNNQRVKIKTLNYLNLHHAKDAVNFREEITDFRRLYNCVVNEQADDLKSLLRDMPEVIKVIEKIEEQVIPNFNHMIKEVETFYNENKHLDKKIYAQEGQKINDGFFQLKMMKYLGKEVDFKGFAVKNQNLFYKEKNATKLKP